jgi:hypothetical protein
MKGGFLSYQVGGITDISFDLSIREWVEGTLPDVSMYDLDNHSDPFIVDMTSHELNKLDHLLVYIKVHNPSGHGILLSRLGSLVRKGIKLKIILDGNDEQLKKSCQILAKDNFICDINYSDQQNNILNFFIK